MQNKSEDTKKRETLGREAGEIARADTLKHCKAIGLTPRKVLRRIKEGLYAKENKIFYDKDRGRCVVGPDQINHTARAKAVDQAISVFGINAPEKSKIEFPDENGKPQKIGGLFTDMERATRLVYLLTQAAKRKNAECKTQPQKLKK
jgi:hypothetical protein